MKTLVFLLVLANLLFYAFSAGYFGRPDNPDGGRVEQQVLPERMRIVSRGEAPAKPVKPEPTAAESKPLEAAPDAEKAPAEKPASTELEASAEKVDKTPVCLSWRPLPAAEADRLSSLLAKGFADYRQTRKLVALEGNGWWVSIPPLPGKAEADKKAGELRHLEVTDFFVVQDAPSRFAISLGIFSTEKGAQDRLAELKAKGVRSAVVALRPGKDSLVALQATGPVGDKAQLLAAVGQALPKAEALACK